MDGEPLALWRDSTTPPVPGPITPIAPIGSTQSATPTYEWQDEGSASKYRLKIIDKTLETVVYNEVHPTGDICTAGTCSVLPAGISLNFAKNHRWRVKAKNAAGWSEWSEKIFFDYLDAPPGMITAISPIASTLTATPAYEWQDLGNADSYQLKVHDKFLSTLVYNETTLAADSCSNGTCSVTPPGISLNFHANHFWRLRAKNTGGWGEWSEKFYFDYLDTPPGLVALGNPVGVISNTTPSYEWTPLSSATQYRFKVIDRDANVVLYNEVHQASEVCTATDCSLVPPAITLTAGTRYRWRVRAGNSGGWGDWSAKQFFELDGGQ